MHTHCVAAVTCAGSVSNAVIIAAVFALQVAYLTGSAESVWLRRELPHASGGAAAMADPVRFSAAVAVPFVPAAANPSTRWKHHFVRAFAQRYVLPLTLAAGTPAEGAELARCAAALPPFLRRLCSYRTLEGYSSGVEARDAALLDEMEAAAVRSALRCAEPIKTPDGKNQRLST